jgi:flavin reductase (DIM6/NTAB) family NADH-FMN oxidoreductase RutF
LLEEGRQDQRTDGEQRGAGRLRAADHIGVQFIKESKVFTASVIAQTAPLKLIGGFGFKSGRDVNKFEGVKYKLGQSGAPVILDGTLGYLEARVIDSVDTKTHTIFVGELIGAEVLAEGEPMTYAYYHVVKRGTTPKSAPSFNKA